MGVQIELSEASLFKTLKKVLRMINLSEFIKSLKISWFRRVIQNSEKIEWYSNKFFSCEPRNSVELSKNLHNPFGKIVLTCGQTFVMTVK